MKFRNAHFKKLPMSDIVKITYFERLINKITAILVTELSQDVMCMTTRDWVILLGLPIRLILCPISTVIAYRKDLIDNEHATFAEHIVYSDFVLYWRKYDDFETKPYMWNK